MELLKKTPRIEVVDALRGFAVMAILLYTIWNISFSLFIRRVLPNGLAF